MVSRRRQMQFERVGMDLEKVKHKVQKIIDECVAENFTMRESRLLAKELDYALDQIEMRSLVLLSGILSGPKPYRIQSN